MQPPARAISSPRCSSTRSATSTSKCTTATASCSAASRGTSDSEFIDLAGRRRAPITCRVAGFGGATNPQYSLAINGSGPDRYDEQNPNDTAAAATNLRTVGGQFQEIGLNIHNSTDQDWFRFATTATAGAGQQVALDFEHVSGDLDLFLSMRRAPRFWQVPEA